MTNYEKLREILIEKGMDKKWSGMFVKKLSDDEKAFPTDEKTKRLSAFMKAKDSLI